jgi:hypothetical protein
VSAKSSWGSALNPPRLKKPSRHHDRRANGRFEEHKAALRQVFGETLSDEFVDMMLTKLISACVQDCMTFLRKQL